MYPYISSQCNQEITMKCSMMFVSTNFVVGKESSVKTSSLQTVPDRSKGLIPQFSINMSHSFSSTMTRLNNRLQDSFMTGSTSNNERLILRFINILMSKTKNDWHSVTGVSRWSPMGVRNCESGEEVRLLLYRLGRTRSLDSY